MAWAARMQSSRIWWIGDEVHALPVGLKFSSGITLSLIYFYELHKHTVIGYTGVQMRVFINILKNTYSLAGPPSTRLARKIS